MSASARKVWTQQEFFDWAETREERYEFDGFAPVAMTGGTLNHNTISLNILGALRQRLRGSACRPFGLDAAIVTANDAVRYPDAVVTCSKVDGPGRIVPDPVIVFEVLSPTTGRSDRIVKLREYHAVDSIRRYVIVESNGSGLTVLAKQTTGQWHATALTIADTLALPEINVEIPVAEFYLDVELPAEE